ncbi:MAG: class I SAM-dependent methyltransferase [Bacteroidetes bacterium HGW-Bacteroidetes-7]|nr:MAG: class I SAM-dependent methyltransferase [Bacteroidetes bacterium HGW-Bacteroidetes-7]
MLLNCPLCNSSDIISVKNIFFKERLYAKCNKCSLIYLHPQMHPCKTEEKKRYDQHNNHDGDPGYTNHLKRVIEPSLKYLKTGMVGVDYGCGPRPVLSSIIEEYGYRCDYYDPYFFPETIDNEYDFIFSTEVFEHFFNPKKEIEKIVLKLKDNGILAIMTEMWNDIDSFKNWYYIRDNTHVCFYNFETMQYICKQFNLEILLTDNKRITIFQKSPKQ